MERYEAGKEQATKTVQVDKKALNQVTPLIVGHDPYRKEDLHQHSEIDSMSLQCFQNALKLHEAIKRRSI